MTEKSATYRDVFGAREYRHLFAANVLSMVGDQLAAVALAVLVLKLSDSPALAAASFASTYLAWIIGGPVLSVLADRLPRRTVLIACDLVRAALFLMLTIDAFPAWALITLAFVAHLFHAPFLAARASLVPDILEGDRYTVANGLDNVFQSIAQIAGFAVGGMLLTVLSAHEALMLDALTFVASAVLIKVGVRHRPAAVGSAPARNHAERIGAVTAGVRIIFSDPTLRAYVLLLWVGCAFVFAPEGLMVSLAGQYGGGSGLGGLLLAAAPLGGAIGAVVLTRLCGPARRQRLIVPLALVSCVVLIPIALQPPLWLVLGLLTVAGFSNAYCVPLNPLFGRAVPSEYRARAFGVAISGLCAAQGLAMVGAGLLAEHVSPTAVVGACGIIGTLAVAAVTLRWPRAQTSLPAPAQPEARQAVAAAP